MKPSDFEDLLESVRQGGAILRGERAPSRSTPVEEPDVAAIRGRFGLTQEAFAAMLGISRRTLENWEQGRRTPRGPARVLLRVAARHPDAVLDAVRESSGAGPRALPRAAERTLPEHRYGPGSSSDGG